MERKQKKEFVKKVVKAEPVNKVVSKGTKVEMQVASSREKVQEEWLHHHLVAVVVTMVKI